MLASEGSYTHEQSKVVMCLARRYESDRIFELINEIDPNAFVSMSRVVGVFGEGFARIHSAKKKK